jgi:hypothetical protein
MRLTIVLEVQSWMENNPLFKFSGMADVVCLLHDKLREKIGDTFYQYADRLRANPASSVYGLGGRR